MFQAPTTAAPSQSAELLRSRSIEHVVVLGANGAMGLGSGALFTTAVKKVTFLARTKDKAQSGLDQAIRMVRSSTVGLRVEVGSYDDDFDRAVGEADLIFEAVTEILDLKQQFFERIDKVAPGRLASSATVTSRPQHQRRSPRAVQRLLQEELPAACISSTRRTSSSGTELIAGETRTRTRPSLDFIETYSKKRPRPRR